MEAASAARQSYALLPGVYVFQRSYMPWLMSGPDSSNPLTAAVYDDMADLSRTIP